MEQKQDILIGRDAELKHLESGETGQAGTLSVVCGHLFRERGFSCAYVYEPYTEIEVVTDVLGIKRRNVSEKNQESEYFGSESGRHDSRQ